MEQTPRCVSLLKAPQQRTKAPTCVEPPRHPRVSLVLATFMMSSSRIFLPHHNIFTRTDPPRLVDNLDMLLTVRMGGVVTSKLMVSALDSGASGPGSNPGLGHCVVFLGKTLYRHSASLHPGV